jgi:CheY-like chemotaxis protein
MSKAVAGGDLLDWNMPKMDGYRLTVVAPIARW